MGFSHANKTQNQEENSKQTHKNNFILTSSCGHLNVMCIKVDLEHVKWQEVLRASLSLTRFDKNKAIETIIHCEMGKSSERGFIIIAKQANLEYNVL